MFDADALPLIGPEGENLVVVIVKGTFTFASGPSRPADEQITIAYGDMYEGDGGGIMYESDIVPFKPGTDIVLCASAYAPEEKPAESVPVTVRVGPVEKHLLVFGDRYWNHAGVLSRGYTITAAKPFAKRPIRYEDAFGGMDTVSGEYCAENLAGKGLYSVSSRQNLAGKPLPCIEDPHHLIRNVKDRPRPVSLGFYNRAWQPRAAYAGTYDETWRKQRCPLPPEDLDPRFYQGAHPDLQTKAYLRGDEPVNLIHLTPDGNAEFDLPDVRPSCTITRKIDNGQRGRESLSLNLDTLFIEPDQQRYCMVWRGAAEVEELSTAGIDQVGIGCNKE